MSIEILCSGKYSSKGHLAVKTYLQHFSFASSTARGRSVDSHWNRSTSFAKISRVLSSWTLAFRMLFIVSLGTSVLQIFNYPSHKMLCLIPPRNDVYSKDGPEDVTNVQLEELLGPHEQMYYYIRCRCGRAVTIQTAFL